MKLATRVVVLKATEIRCHGRHPYAQRMEQYRHSPCNKFIIEMPFLVRFTGRVLRRFENVRPGMIAARCRVCGAVNEFEIIPPAMESPS